MKKMPKFWKKNFEEILLVRRIFRDSESFHGGEGTQV